MNRPWLIWTVLGVCALLIMGAMAWSTNKAMQLEEKQALAESAAELQERIRLSLSRMDTAASGILVLENQRPLHHYEAFFEPEDVLTNQFQVVGKGFVYQPSPLLPRLPDFVRLHFEIDAETRVVSSPQVPVGNEWDYAEQNGIEQLYLDNNKGELKTLRELLAEPSSSELAEGGTQLDLICSACVHANDLQGNLNQSWNAPDAVTVQQKEVIVAQGRGDYYLNRGSKYQEDLGLIEKSKRAGLYKDNSERAVPKGQALRNAGANQVRNATSPPSRSQSPPSPEQQQQQQQATSQAAEEGGEQSQVVDQAQSYERSKDLVEPPSEVTPFQPIWLGDELFVVREVSTAGALRYQGVWLKADTLAGHLLGVAEDLLPNANLEAISAISAASLPGAFELKLDELSNDPLSLVTLPWRLRAGESPMAAEMGWSPLRISLTVGWVALLIALISSAFLVRGVMKLSDRRATFVSSVTHELRTPLTTFHLYSDMLAEGMVKEEAKQKEYLTTMRREAERLNHLVENVLSYSKVERGSARAQHQQISLESLVERMHPRLSERVSKDSAKLQVESIESVDQVQIETDLTAVEQIVFNLVDNACKYGLAEVGERVVHLRACNGGKLARIEVCDEGGGIARSDLKKLFRPFHKSARDAAHSKPGVGLGLALCRRLARELGGNLTLDAKRKEGACFILELPIAGK